MCIKPFVDNYDYKTVLESTGKVFTADETYIKINKPVFRTPLHAEIIEDKQGIGTWWNPRRPRRALCRQGNQKTVR